MLFPFLYRSLFTFVVWFAAFSLPPFPSLSLSLFGQFFAIELAALAEGQIEERFEWQMDKRKILKFGLVRLEILAFGLVISAPGWTASSFCNRPPHPLPRSWNDAIVCDFPVMKSKRWAIIIYKLGGLVIKKREWKWTYCAVILHFTRFYLKIKLNLFKDLRDLKPEENGK